MNTHIPVIIIILIIVCFDQYPGSMCVMWHPSLTSAALESIVLFFLTEQLRLDGKEYY